MQIDPRLERLQALIEQKRTMQAPSTAGSSRVGRAGNPRFAEAARRVRMANAQRTGNPAVSSSDPVYRTSNAAPVSSTRTETVDSVSRMRERGRLTQVEPERNVYLNDSPKPRPSAEGHLGHYIDTFA